MNPRVLNVVLAVQVLFAGALLYAGYSSREGRKIGYLELTHRVTAGQALVGDFEQLTGFLSDTADKSVVRSLFGLPVARATEITLADKSVLKGDLWIYYPLATLGTPENPTAPIDSADADKLKGPVTCYVFEFDKRGRAKWQRADVIHPIVAPSAIPPGK